MAQRANRPKKGGSLVQRVSVTFDHPEQTTITSDLRSALQSLDDNIIPGDVRVTSGYRSPSYNKKVGGAKKSLHMHRKAADINMTGWSPELRQAAIAHLVSKGITNFITYAKSPNMLHVDMRKQKGAFPSFMFKDKRGNYIQQKAGPSWFRAVENSVKKGIYPEAPTGPSDATLAKSYATAYGWGYRPAKDVTPRGFNAPDVRGLARGYGELAKSLQAAGYKSGAGGVVAPSPAATVPGGRSVSPVASNFPARPAGPPSGLPAPSSAPRGAVSAVLNSPPGLGPSVAALNASMARNLNVGPGFAPATVAGSVPATAAGASRMMPSTGMTPQQSVTRAASPSVGAVPRGAVQAALDTPAGYLASGNAALQGSTSRNLGWSPTAARFKEVTGAVPTARPAPSRFQTVTSAVPTARPTTQAPSRFQDVTSAVPTARPAAAPVTSRFQDVTTAVPTARPAISTPAKTAAVLASKQAPVQTATVASKPVTSIAEAQTAPRPTSAVQTGAFPAAPAPYDPAHPPGVMGKLGDLAQRYAPQIAGAALAGPIGGLAGAVLGMSLNNAKPGQLLGNPFAGLGKMFQSAPQTYQGPRSTYGSGLSAISDVLGGGTPVGATAYSRSTPGYRVTNVGNNVVEKVNQYGFRSYEQVKPGLTASKKTSKAGGSGRSLSPAASRAIDKGQGGLY